MFKLFIAMVKVSIENGSSFESTFKFNAIKLSSQFLGNPQLSDFLYNINYWRLINFIMKMVGGDGLEPPTFSV